MKSWDFLRQRVDQEHTSDPTGLSTAKHLHVIIDYAESCEIDPAGAKNASFSNLRDIVREARNAIKNNDQDRLVELFRLASTYKNDDLRRYLRGDKREKIHVKKSGSEGNLIFHFTVTEVQMEKISRANERNFIFIEE